MDDDEMDPLDAFMARLELPQADADGAALAPLTTERIDWPTAARRRQSATTQDTNSAVVKNRRYRRLQQLLDGAKVVQDPSQPETKEANADDWYFSDAMMQQRNPALFHFHLGQYLPSSSSVNGGDCDGSRPQAHASGKSKSKPLSPEELLLSSFLLDTNDRREMEVRRALEQRTWGKFTGHDVDAAAQREKDLYEEQDEEEEDSSSDEEEKHNHDDDDETKAADVDVSAAAMHERRQNLVEMMAQRFLHGYDGQYVDYTVIDGNEALDDLDQMQRDAEDAYFDMDDD
uniref:CCD97-like C-terminal domain-containing protein n=1 Tax=Globisporangium ultimum (strain ATCC 200006 / CBS 805.95 / DAOM BR144) TaxID=431595 RepID=K3WL78_GLOUD